MNDPNNVVPKPSALYTNRRILFVLLVLVLLPVVVFAALNPTIFSPKASTTLPIAVVKINPGEIIAKPLGQEVHLSTLAFDTSGNPITSGVTYQWGMSSTNSIGTIVQEQGNGALGTFTPSANFGRGDLWVRAFTGTSQGLGSIPVFVGTNPPTPTPAMFYNLSSSMPNPGFATFSFTFTGTSSTFIVNASTVSDMSTDVYHSFASGPSSPIVETNPTKWDKYSCGRTLYWQIRTMEGTQSAIQSNIVTCPTPTPTPRPLPTPTQTPKPRGTPTPTATPNPTPTPTPAPNHAPTISTSGMPILAKLGKQYNGTVVVTDVDPGDTLTMTTTGLPRGIIQRFCMQAIVNNTVQLSCTIAGTSRGMGIYTILIRAQDNRGGVTNKTTNLFVLPLP